MYGIVNKSIEEMVIANHGEDQWLKIVNISGIGISFFICNEFYEDHITDTLVRAISDELSIPFDQLMFDFGEWWILRTVMEKYPGLLLVVGPDLKKFLVNFPDAYDRMKLIYPKIPDFQFRVTHIEENSIQIEIFSDQEGLGPFLKGVLCGLGKLYNSEVTVHKALGSDGEEKFNVYIVSLLANGGTANLTTQSPKPLSVA
jgi:hypothetical protein